MLLLHSRRHSCCCCLEVGEDNVVAVPWHSSSSSSSSPFALWRTRKSRASSALHATAWWQRQEETQQKQPYGDTTTNTQTNNNTSSSSSSSHSSSSSSSSLLSYPAKLVQVVVVQGTGQQQQQQQHDNNNNYNNIGDTASLLPPSSTSSSSSSSLLVDVAAFRNNLTNPIMMVQKAQAKHDAIMLNIPREIQNAFVFGYAAAGPFGAVLQWINNQNIQDALVAYLVFGTTVSISLGISNILEHNLHVPTVAEAAHRIVIKYEEGLFRGQDIGFAAILKTDDDSNNNNTSTSNLFYHNSTHGVVACVDVQWRNSPQSPCGHDDKNDNIVHDHDYQQCPVVPNLPSHLHIKNMLVHDSLRRRGIGQALLDAIEQYAKTQTDAQMLTLELDDSNTAAMNLYCKSGFVPIKTNPNSTSPLTFMTKNLYELETSS